MTLTYIPTLTDLENPVRQNMYSYITTVDLVNYVHQHLCIYIIIDCFRKCCASRTRWAYRLLA